MAAYNYLDACPLSTTTGALTAGQTSITVVSSTGWPSTPYTIALDVDPVSGQWTGQTEICLVTAQVGNVLTVTRGVGNLPAQSHNSGVTVVPCVAAQLMTDASAHHNASSGVHGVAGSVVGTTDAQTVSNKTFTASTLSSPTLTGTLVGSGTVGGATVINTTGAATAASFSATGDGKVSGVHHFKIYSNESTRDTGNPSPAGGDAAFLSNPTKMRNPGPVMYDGSVWGPIGFTRVADTSFNTDLNSSGTTEVVGYSQSVNFVANRRYRIEVRAGLQAATNGNRGGITCRYDASTVTNTSTQIDDTWLVYHPQSGASGKGHNLMVFEFVAPTTGAFNVAIGVLTVNGTGNETIAGASIVTRVRIIDVGV